VLRLRFAPVPCQVPKKEIRRMSSVPSAVTPALERAPDGALATCPSRMKTPVGTPVAKVK
jgi:hypothetical protein